MKQKFSLMDVRAAANELDRRLRGTFIQNFYSRQQKTMFMKLSNKDIVIIEPGMRMHMVREYEDGISHFCKKLREHCRHARIQKISQYGYDRVVVIDIQRCRLVVEFYSMGNIVIIDNEDTIVDILRPVKELGMVKGSRYMFNRVELDMGYEAMCSVGLDEMLPFEKEYVKMVEGELKKRFGEDIQNERNRREIDEYFDEVKSKIECLGWFGEVILNKGKAEMLYSFETRRDEDVLSRMVEQMGLDRKNEICLCDRESVEEEARKKKSKAIHFGSFNEAAEFYFADTKKHKKEKEDKATRIRAAQEKHAEELVTDAEKHREAAEVLERNRRPISTVLEIFKKALDNKMDWKTFEEFWNEERRGGNEYAEMIREFDMQKKRCKVCVENREIELTMGQNIEKNIEEYHQKKKKSMDKSMRTRRAMETVVQKTASKKQHVGTQKREGYWFEKFHYFISSENELVIGGKNAQQNDMIVKRHLENNDIYFHCDVHGASSVICKGTSKATIEEAAWMALCMSACWSEGILRPVFYVSADQVSKTAPSGEYVAKGGFVIRGKKNTVDLHRLEYGVGILFRLEDADDTLDFCSNPTEENRIKHGMPVSGPWTVIRKYRYRMRICPGAGKATGLCQDIQKMFNTMSKGRHEEHAVHAIGLDEYMGVVPRGSRIAKIV